MVESFFQFPVCTAVEAPTELTSLAIPAMDPEAVITSFNQPHIMLGEIALWNVSEDSQNLGSVLCLSLLRIFSNLARW